MLGNLGDWNGSFNMASLTPRHEKMDAAFAALHNTVTRNGSKRTQVVAAPVRMLGRSR